MCRTRLAPRMSLRAALIVAIAACSIGLWEALPFIVGRLVARADQPGAHVGLKRLKIGHAMAGGGEAADSLIADSIKAVGMAKLWGPRRTASRESWRSFANALSAAERSYVAPGKGFGLGPPEFANAEVAEGIRYVSHITRLALELYVESEPDAPRFIRLVAPHLKLIGDNPDALYYISVVDPSTAYLVSGCRTEVYLSLTVHADALPGEGFQRVVADINDGELAFDAAGCWQVLLSPGDAPPAGAPESAVWKSLPPSAATLVTRHYYESTPAAQLNREVQHNLDLSIRVWVPPGGAKPAGAPRPLDDVSMASRLDAARGFVASHTVDMPLPDPATAPPFFSLEPNVIGPPMKWSKDAKAAGMGAVDIAYSAGRWVLKEGEALLIRGRMPACRFANVVLWNRFLQTLDYESKRASLNRAQLLLRGPQSDEFTIVLAERSPFADGAESSDSLGANWLSTEGRASATVFFRFVLPEGEMRAPTTRVLPAGTDVLEALR